MILLTRPLELSLDLQKSFKAYGIDCHIDPLLSITPVEVKWPDLSLYTALIATSSQAIHCLHAAYPFHAIVPSIWCVGSATAKIAQSYGYSFLLSSQESVESLAADITKAYHQAAHTRLLYLSSSVISMNLSDFLHDKGILCDRLVVYTATPAQYLGVETRELFIKKKLKVVLIYSQRTAQSFKVCSNGLENLFSTVAVFCKSAKIERELASIPWKKCFIFNTMSEPTLVQACKHVMDS